MAFKLGIILVSLGFQSPWAEQLINSSKTHSVDPIEVAGIILSEHRGVLTESSVTVVNKNSRCTGLGQIAPFWARHYGLQLKDLKNPLTNIDVTARVIAYAKKHHNRHARTSNHHWIAHYKCGTKNLDSCLGPVRRTKRYIEDVRGLRDNFLTTEKLVALFVAISPFTHKSLVIR